jgi:hypothetical protein
MGVFIKLDDNKPCMILTPQSLISTETFLRIGVLANDFSLASSNLVSSFGQ